MVLGYKFGGCSDGDVFFFLLGLEREREEVRQRGRERQRNKASDLRVQT